VYALENVKKFVRQNRERLGDPDGILERAERESENGVLLGGSIESIMQNEELAEEFHAQAEGPRHRRVGLNVIQKAELEAVDPSGGCENPL